MKIRLSSILLFLPALLLVQGCNVKSLTSVYDLRVGNETEPAGIDASIPVFSWKLKSGHRNCTQAAYQVIVLGQDRKDTCWSSGRVVSDNNLWVRYAGRKLQPFTSFRWKVRIADDTGKWSRWSNESTFSTGPLSGSDWEAEWITSPDSVYSPYFVREFFAGSKPRKAVAFVNCQGYYELYVNGRKAGDDVLSPAVSDFRYENYYITYDITSLLKKGSNTIGILTGRGWYSPGLPGVVNDAPVLRCQVHVSSPSENFIVATDSLWLTAESNIRQIGKWRWNDMGGELIDGRITMAGWCSVKEGMKNAIIAAAPPAETKYQICRTNHVSNTVPVIRVSEAGNHAWLTDFGKNFTGWLEMVIRGQQPGDTIKFTYSDFCNKIPVKQSGGKWDFGNVHIDQRDAFICSGKDADTFCIKFNYHAFRYAVIEGLAHKPEAKDIRGLTIEADFQPAGSFSSSDSDLNSIYELNKHTFRCLSLGGYYVDCPHRERLGYGDGQVAVETGIYNYELYNFYKKWAVNWLNTQDSSGNIAHTAPSPYDAGGGPAWGGTAVVLPWKIFNYYGDTAFLASSYDKMVRYSKFLESRSVDGILKHYGDPVWGFIGDWLPPGKGMDTGNWGGATEKELFNNCYLLYLYEILEKSAATLSKQADVEAFRASAIKLKEKINKLYYNREKGVFADGGQTYLSFPLLLNVPEETEMARVFANLENEIRVVNTGHINTGMLGTYFILKYLTEAGRADLVYLMMKQKTYPGWGFMVAQGASTCWEQWNGYWSNIHSCFTSGGGWFHYGVAGIGQKENSVAFKHAVITPVLSDSIAQQNTTFTSPFGTITSSWTRKKDGAIEYHIGIPPNTHADLILPVAPGQVVYESGKEPGDIGDITVQEKKEGKLKMTIGSGEYVFEVKKKNK